MKNGHLAGKGPGHHLSFLMGIMLFFHYSEVGRQEQGREGEVRFFDAYFL